MLALMQRLRYTNVRGLLPLGSMNLILHSVKAVMHLLVTGIFQSGPILQTVDQLGRAGAQLSGLKLV